MRLRARARRSRKGGDAYPPYPMPEVSSWGILARRSEEF